MTAAFLDLSEIEQIRTVMNNDPEFKIAARFMSEDILLEVGNSKCIVKIRDGVLTEIKLDPTFIDPWSFSVKATAESWDKLLQSTPPPFYTGLLGGMLRGNLQISGNLEAAFAHFWALSRMLDVMKQLQNHYIEYKDK